MGLPQQSFGAGLEHGSAALFDLCLPASELGKLDFAQKLDKL